MFQLTNTCRLWSLQTKACLGYRHDCFIHGSTINTMYSVYEGLYIFKQTRPCIVYHLTPLTVPLRTTSLPSRPLTLLEFLGEADRIHHQRYQNGDDCRQEDGRAVRAADTHSRRHARIHSNVSEHTTHDRTSSSCYTEQHISHHSAHPSARAEPAPQDYIRQ